MLSGASVRNDAPNHSGGTNCADERRDIDAEFVVGRGAGKGHGGSA
jgi:hypothetical protein